MTSAAQLQAEYLQRQEELNKKQFDVARKEHRHWIDCYERITGGPGMQHDVLRFMELAEQRPRDRALGPIAPEDLQLAHKLIVEEVQEMLAAWEKLNKEASIENLTEFADGAIDTIYVVLWALAKFNLPTAALWNEVQRSNMAKDRGDGKMDRNEFGKVVKPAGWTPPNLHAIVMEHYDVAQWKGNVRVHSAQEYHEQYSTKPVQGEGNGPT